VCGLESERGKLKFDATLVNIQTHTHKHADRQTDKQTDNTVTNLYDKRSQLSYK